MRSLVRLAHHVAASSVVLAALTAAVAHADFMDHFVVRDDVGPHKVPYLGPAELLLIPVEVKGYPAFDRAKLQTFYAQDFVQYYETASLGRYKPKVTVAPTITFDACPLPPAQFPNCSVARGDINAFTAGIDMLRDVVRKADQAGVDFSKFDVNGRRNAPDTYADGVMILTNIPFGGIAFPFGYFNRGDNLAGGMGGPLIVDGVRMPHFAIAGESDNLVMLHEFGHVLGLTDLYDESGKYDGLHLSFMGSWLYDPKIPLPDAETRWRLRWGNWHQVQGQQKVVIQPAETSGEVWRLGTGDEYWLVENRGPGKYDQHLPVRGLAVFHVDRTVKTLKGEEGRFLERVLDCVNCNAWRPYIQWVQADGRFTVQKNGKEDYAEDLFRDGDLLVPIADETPFSATHHPLSSNWYSGKISEVVITDIKVRADGAIEATLEAPAKDQCGESLCAEGEGCKPLTCELPPAPAGCGCNSGSALGLSALIFWLALTRARRAGRFSAF